MGVFVLKYVYLHNIIIIIIIIKIFVSRLNCTYNYENISELTKRHRSPKSVKF